MMDPDPDHLVLPILKLICNTEHHLKYLTLFHPHFSTPPSRTKAFEEFKQEKGSEINRILVENKGNYMYSFFQ